jgi:hypothetical protein
MKCGTGRSVPLSTSLPTDLYGRLATYASRRGMTKSALGREMARVYDEYIVGRKNNYVGRHRSNPYTNGYVDVNSIYHKTRGLE